MQNNIILYQTENKNVTINVTYLNESFWLFQKIIEQLFGIDRTVITKHLKNIFETNELEENSVCAIFALTEEDY